MELSNYLVERFDAEPPTLMHRMAEQIAADPARAFILFGEDDKAESYGVFDEAAARLAASFATLGVGGGTRVSVLSANGEVCVRTMFACWKLGAIYCPINHRFTGDLLSYVLNDTAPALLVVDEGLVAPLAAVLGDVQAPPAIVVHRPRPSDYDYDPALAGTGFAGEAGLFSDLLASSPYEGALSLTAGSPSSIIYTSGTTGQPKGVVHHHGWLHGLCCGLSGMLHRDDALYCDLPMYHIGGAFSSVARAAWAGASIGVWSRFSTQEFWPRIEKCGASVVVLLDVMSDWLMAQPETAADRENTIIRAHMQPLPDHHHAMAQRFGFDFVAVGYGSTEIGLGFTGLVDEFPGGQGTPDHLWKGYSREEIVALITAMAGPYSIVDGSKPVPKGFMGAPTGMYAPSVLDADDQEVGPGEQGQLVLNPRRPVLFQDYFGKPEVTAEVQRPQGFFSSDIVKRDGNGAFYFCDRKQGFIRVRGENVAASVVESGLNAHPKVNYCAVVAIPAAVGSEDDIAAFVVVHDGAVLSEADIITFAGETMPKFMVPKHVRLMDALPTTPTMKIEKYKLKDQILAELAATG